MTSLWKPIKIPVIGVSGEFGAGKTLFLLSVAESDKPFLYYDMEKSGETYQDLFPNMVRIDLPELTAEKYPKGYTEKELFEVWHDHIRSVKAGEYQVICVDTLDALEIGLQEKVDSNYRKYGCDSKQELYAHGRVWPILKSEWRRILLGEIAVKCESFVFATHLKSVWKNQRPTKDKMPAGKDILMQLASVYLWIKREPNKTVPTATVLKSRLMVRGSNGEFQPVLPERLSQATPEQIRKYIAEPPDYTNLKPWEKVTETTLSEDDKLQLQLEIESVKAEAQTAARDAELAAERTEEIKERARQRLLGKQAVDQPVLWDEIVNLLEMAKQKGVDAQLEAAIKRDLQCEDINEDIVTKIQRTQLNSYRNKLERVK